jgi:glycosyltransferase involved in cell wall biosynthesis
MKVKEIIQSTDWMPNLQNSRMEPTFSILMPIYRRYLSGHLTRAIQSVLNQTYKEFELLIIDDGSVDGSFGEIQRFMQLDPRIHCLHHRRNVGLPAIGCYEAYRRARGEYLMFCFDDTEYQVNALERAARYISDYRPKIAFGYIDYQYSNLNGKISVAYWGRDKIPQANLVMANFLPNLGAIVHREVPDEIGFLDPHFAIARLTDWDYWKRAAKVYEIHYSSIHIGTEFGRVTDNSLGHTYPVNSWTAYEWTQRARNSALVPGRYEEYDVQEIPNDLSDQSKLVLRDLSKFYENKFWYIPQKPLTLSSLEKTGYTDANGKILILTLLQDAPVTQSFEYLPDCGNTIRYVSPLLFDCRELVHASALIVSRDLFHPDLRRWVETARQLAIPHYYYLDENFIIWRGKIRRLKKYTVENLKKELASFQGVLVGHQELADFLAENDIHSKIYVFPRVMPSEPWLDRSLIPEKSAGVTRIGFMGQPHLHHEFVKIILPAIRQLAKHYPVELVISGNHRSFDQANEPQLKIYHFPSTSSVRLAIGRMQSAGIDILVQPGSRMHDNPYETQSALWNAWVMKAIPILTNQHPYTDVETLGLGLVCIDADQWYEKLLLAVSDFSLIARLKENLNRYAMENYSGSRNIEVLKAINTVCLAPGVAIIENRFRMYLDMAGKATPLLSTGNSFILRGFAWLAAILRRNRHWLLPPYSPQERFVRFMYRNFLSGLRR